MPIVPRSFAPGALVALAAAVAATPSIARPATARLVSCEDGDCLLVRGFRPTSQAPVRINDRPVAVRGGKAWQVRLPVTTVRAWSAPFARTLHVAIVDPAARDEDVRLPIGLLGTRTELAALVVRAR